MSAVELCFTNKRTKEGMILIRSKEGLGAFNPVFFSYCVALHIVIPALEVSTISFMKYPSCGRNSSFSTLMPPPRVGVRRWVAVGAKLGFSNRMQNTYIMKIYLFSIQKKTYFQFRLGHSHLFCSGCLDFDGLFAQLFHWYI